MFSFIFFAPWFSFLRRVLICVDIAGRGSVWLVLHYDHKSAAQNTLVDRLVGNAAKGGVGKWGEIVRHKYFFS